jgi:purine nucleoside permease
MQIRAVVLAAFEPDAGPVPGELRFWMEREGIDQELPFAAGYRPLRLRGDGVLAVITGVGAARAASSILALGLDPRFDLSQALWIVTGVAGIDPARGSLGSVVLPEFVVDGSLTHEIDAREIPSAPSAWSDGFVPIGKTLPYEAPLEQRFNGEDGIVFRLNGALVQWAFDLGRSVELMDSPSMAARRVQFSPAATAHRPPSVLRGDELASTTFWHGRLLSERARRWVAYQTEGAGDYTLTAMEDAGILEALTRLARAGRVDSSRVLVVRGASNFDQQRPGISAAESLAETRVASYSAYRPALENAWRVGSAVLRAWLQQELAAAPDRTEARA